MCLSRRRRRPGPRCTSRRRGAPRPQHQTLPPGFEVSGWQLPSYDNRLGLPEFVPSAHPPRHEKASKNKKRRRKQRVLIDRRAEFRDSNMERADRAVAAAAAFKPDSGDRPPRHLDFPRSEKESPLRPLAPRPTPRQDQQRGRASDGAREASEDEEEEEDKDEEIQEPQPRPACPERRRHVVSL